jgi:hypothetical protein
VIAHPAGNQMELIPLQPDERERSDRKLLLQPGGRRSRETYKAARGAPAAAPADTTGGDRPNGRVL